MSTGKSYNEILDEMLSEVGTEYDKRESSVIYNTLAPAAMEFTNIFAELAQMEDEAFADTASFPSLKRIAAERGLTPYGASAAEVLGEFNIEISTGTRFTGIDTTLNYSIAERVTVLGDDYDSTMYYYKMTCETEGETGNSYTGAIIPLDGDIEGLTTAKIISILTRGEDAEDVESFRTRYFDSITNQSFGGNIQQYKEEIHAIAGVGGCKVYPHTTADGETKGGYVKIVIQDADYGVPSESLINDVQTAIDPTVNQGQGLGLAPIGHIVTVAGVQSQTCDISFSLTYADGVTWDDVEDSVKTSIQAYFDELNADWENEDGITISFSQILGVITDIDGINDIDFTTMTINDNTKTFTLGADYIAVLGTVTDTSGEDE